MQQNLSEITAQLKEILKSPIRATLKRLVKVTSSGDAEGFKANLLQSTSFKQFCPDLYRELRRLNSLFFNLSTAAGTS